MVSKENSLIIENRSKKFLKDIMGKKIYDKFIKNGKIELRSGEYLYELKINGMITNKTTNQRYCITLAPGTPDRENFPWLDIIAVKYAWLKHRADFVEKIANKGCINYDMYLERLYKGYTEFINHMESIGWRRKRSTINENGTDLVIIQNVYKNSRDIAIAIRVPSSGIITMRGDSTKNAYRLAVRFANKNGREIPQQTNIEIVKITAIGDNIISSPIYSNINMAKDIKIPIRNIKVPKINSEKFAFEDNVFLTSGQSLGIRVIDPGCDIDKRETKLSIDIDIWSRD